MMRVRVSALQRKGEVTGKGSEARVTASKATARVVVPVPSVSRTGAPATACAEATGQRAARATQKQSQRATLRWRNCSVIRLRRTRRCGLELND
jgi:hypothetical protein